MPRLTCCWFILAVLLSCSYGVLITTQTAAGPQSGHLCSSQPGTTLGSSLKPLLDWIARLCRSKLASPGAHHCNAEAKTSTASHHRTARTTTAMPSSIPPPGPHLPALEWSPFLAHRTIRRRLDSATFLVANLRVLTMRHECR
jgi:hypothetical protein